MNSIFQGMAIIKKRKYRICPQCGRNISLEHGNTKHCDSCKTEYRKNYLSRWYRTKKIDILLPNMKSNYDRIQRSFARLNQLNVDPCSIKVCHYCGVDISDYHGNAKFCKNCKSIHHRLYRYRYYKTQEVRPKINFVN